MMDTLSSKVILSSNTHICISLILRDESCGLAISRPQDVCTENDKISLDLVAYYEERR